MVKAIRSRIEIIFCQMATMATMMRLMLLMTLQDNDDMDGGVNEEDCK